MTTAATKSDTTLPDVVYLDNSYTTAAGHNRPYLEAAVRELDRRGHRVIAYVHRQLPEAPETKLPAPHLLLRSFHTYTPEFRARMPRWLHSKIKTLLGLLFGNVDASLRTFKAGWRSPAASIVVANGFASNLPGTYVAFRALGVLRRGPKRVIVVVHNRPSAAVATVVRRSLAALHRAVDLCVVVHAARNTDVADDCNVVLLPLPYVRARKVRRQPSGTRTFGYLGLASEAKGFVAMAEAITLVRHRTERARFVIQTNPRPEPAVLSAIERLRKLAVSTDGVDLLDGPLSDAEYDETFEQVDVMLLPHHADAYATDESGVFLECVASGMPVIASNETAMGARVASSEAAGWLFVDGNGESLADAIVRATFDGDVMQPSVPFIADPARDFADILVGAFATAETESTRLTHSPIARSTYRTS